MSKSDINQVILEGNITRDPELRFTPNGKAVADFGLATNDSKPDGKGGWDDVPNFFDVTAWESLAENAAQSFSKGDRVIVVGRLRYESWETPEGDKRSKVRIVADSVGPSIRWSTTTQKKNPKGTNGVHTGADKVALEAFVNEESF